MMPAGEGGYKIFSKNSDDKSNGTVAALDQSGIRPRKPKSGTAYKTLRHVINNKRKAVNTSLMKVTLRANNKALAQALQTTRQCMKERQDTIVELQRENSELRAAVGEKMPANHIMEEEVNRQISAKLTEVHSLVSELATSLERSSDVCRQLARICRPYVNNDTASPNPSVPADHNAQPIKKRSVAPSNVASTSSSSNDNNAPRTPSLPVPSFKQQHDINLSTLFEMSGIVDEDIRFLDEQEPGRKLDTLDEDNVLPTASTSRSRQRLTAKPRRTSSLLGFATAETVSTTSGHHQQPEDAVASSSNNKGIVGRRTSQRRSSTTRSYNQFEERETGKTVNNGLINGGESGGEGAVVAPAAQCCRRIQIVEQTGGTNNDALTDEAENVEEDVELITDEAPIFEADDLLQDNEDNCNDDVEEQQINAIPKQAPFTVRKKRASATNSRRTFVCQLSQNQHRDLINNGADDGKDRTSGDIHTTSSKALASVSKRKTIVLQKGKRANVPVVELSDDEESNSEATTSTKSSINADVAIDRRKTVVLKRASSNHSQPSLISRVLKFPSKDSYLKSVEGSEKLPVATDPHELPEFEAEHVHVQPLRNEVKKNGHKMVDRFDREVKVPSPPSQISASSEEPSCSIATVNVEKHVNAVPNDQESLKADISKRRVAVLIDKNDKEIATKELLRNSFSSPGVTTGRPSSQKHNVSNNIEMSMDISELDIEQETVPLPTVQDTKHTNDDRNNNGEENDSFSVIKKTQKKRRKVILDSDSDDDNDNENQVGVVAKTSTICSSSAASFKNPKVPPKKRTENSSTKEATSKKQKKGTTRVSKRRQVPEESSRAAASDEDDYLILMEAEEANSYDEDHDFPAPKTQKKKPSDKNCSKAMNQKKSDVRASVKSATPQTESEHDSNSRTSSVMSIEGGGRTRRAKQAVSYVEPTLNKKLRRV